MREKDLAVRDLEGRRLCPVCHAPVSEDAAKCPLCGAVLKKRARARLPVVEMVFLLVLILGLSWWKHQPGFGAPSGALTLPPTPTFTSTPTATFTPTVTPTPTATPTPKLVYHKVQPGENLSIIAAEYDVPVDEIVKANNLPSAQYIVVGQKLLIPKGYIPPTPTPVVTKAIALNYIVQQGDTLGFISLSFHVPIPTLMAANHMTGTTIHPGEVILIPESGNLNALTPTPFVGPAPVTPRALKPMPKLLTPPDGALLNSGGPVFLSWTSDRWLRESDWYHLRVWREGSTCPVVDVLTKATSWRLPVSVEGGHHGSWKWQVEIVESKQEIEGTPVPGVPVPESGSRMWRFRW